MGYIIKSDIHQQWPKPDRLHRPEGISQRTAQNKYFYTRDSPIAIHTHSLRTRNLSSLKGNIKNFIHPYLFTIYKISFTHKANEQTNISRGQNMRWRVLHPYFKGTEHEMTYSTYFNGTEHEMTYSTYFNGTEHEMKYSTYFNGTEHEMTYSS